ncbi:vasotab-TY1-like [Arctopsyche grandis]|uniref:vasotab-TY1-like n=1 Tax=Arctopsyche grandis TaxID=121162 RepID=UPI00406D8689
MKATFVLFFCILLVSTGVKAETDCPDVCPMNFQPLCGISSTGETRTFGNRCEMETYNCRQLLGIRRKTNLDFTKKSDGECE